MGILRTALIGTAAYHLGKKSFSNGEKKERKYESSNSTPPPQYQYGQPPYGQNPYTTPQYPQGYGGNYQGYPPQHYSRGVEDPSNDGGSRSMQTSPPPYQPNTAYENENEKSPTHSQTQGKQHQERPN
ncbi:hypothetical protein N7486_004626 [Penicillium sp. IBT 16267x]|nr:hypothetical protein N7486_004626 [Penicillium sp. IBT 16267x]